MVRSFLISFLYNIDQEIVVMKGQSEQRAINFGQKYKLPDWKSSSVVSDPDVPSAALGFFNGVQAAPVISMITNGVATPSKLFSSYPRLFAQTC